MENVTTRVLRLPEVIQLCGLSRSSIYAFIKKGAFPAPVPLGMASVGWLSGEIESWIAERASLRSVAGGAAK